MQLMINIDVPELQSAVSFYTQALGLCAVRRVDDAIAELEGGPCTLFLLAKPEGSPATLSGGASAPPRSYTRHWTPVHLDIVVEDLEPAVARAVSAGATVELAPTDYSWGRMAVLADPFGHGFCFVQFVGRGYDELAVRGS
jgi:predicted enzyme related to lactoylglutathione lyase